MKSCKCTCDKYSHLFFIKQPCRTIQPVHLTPNQQSASALDCSHYRSYLLSFRSNAVMQPAKLLNVMPLSLPPTSTIVLFSSQKMREPLKDSVNSAGVIFSLGFTILTLDTCEEKSLTSNQRKKKERDKNSILP